MQRWRCKNVAGTSAKNPGWPEQISGVRFFVEFYAKELAMDRAYRVIDTNAFAWRFILVKGKPMKKAAVVLSAAAVIAMTTVAIPTPVEARGGRGWGPGIAGGLIAGALIGGLASSAYGYGPGYGYYEPGYGYYGGPAPVYYGGYGSTYYGGYGHPGGYGYNRFKNWGG